MQEGDIFVVTDAGGGTGVHRVLRTTGLKTFETSEKNDPYAKPNAGMFKIAQKEISGLRWSNGFYVGDKMTDLKAAMKVGARPVLVRTGYGGQTEQDLNKYTYKQIKRRSYVFDSLQDFAENL